MKVGILTFHLAANYGAFLQAYCLAGAIRRLGHQVEIINYMTAVHWASARFKPWVYRRPWKLWHDFRKHQAFHKAHSSLPLTAFTTDPTRVDWNAYDAIVIGSDIVWNCEIPHFGDHSEYFGRFRVPYRGRLIAYAPSVGPMRPDYPVSLWMAEQLRRFHFICVRDANTQRFVENHIGTKPSLVVDPTWLADEVEKGPWTYGRRTPRQFLLVYSFPLEGRAIDEIRSIAMSEDLLVTGVGYWQRHCERNWADVDPFEWVQLFQQAKYIVSGTFHGTLYAIREKKAFCLLANEGSDSKVSTALSFVALEGRRTADPANIRKILSAPIDYGVAQGRLREQRQQSLLLLKQALA
jgi:hypothetical protein